MSPLESRKLESFGVLKVREIGTQPTLVAQIFTLNADVFHPLPIFSSRFAPELLAKM